MQKQTIVDQIEVQRDGTLHIRLACLIMDGEEVLSRHYHRTALAPGGNLKEQMAAVNAHLAQMKFAAVSDDEIGRIAKHA